jgi:hypothetical protein
MPLVNEKNLVSGTSIVDVPFFYKKFLKSFFYIQKKLKFAKNVYFCSVISFCQCFGDFAVREGLKRL